MRIPAMNVFQVPVLAAALLLSMAIPYQAHAQARPVLDIHMEVDRFVGERMKELVSQGKRPTSDKREDLERQKKSLAGKYASETGARTDLKDKDYYYLGLLYVSAENDPKALDAMKKFLASYPPETKGDMIQSARSYVLILSSRRKQMAEAEQAYQAWLKGDPVVEQQRPMLEQILSVGFFKDGQYDQAVRYGQNAFDLLQKQEARTIAEKRTREQIYMNLVEVLAMSYRKSKNTEQSLNILAEARARSFTIPSANLYRKVMDFVEGSSFSEKKLMQKVESYAKADPAPELKIAEWLGQEPATLEDLRGRVVLLDFWATWCGPCIATFSRLREWHKKFPANDFVIVGVTQYYGRGGEKPMTPLQELDFLREFKQKHKLPYGFAISHAGEAASKYGISAYPTTVLLDRNGVIRYIGIGSGMEESENLEDMIKKVLKEDDRLALTEK